MITDSQTTVPNSATRLRTLGSIPNVFALFFFAYPFLRRTNTVNPKTRNFSRSVNPSVKNFILA
jgi:hypothetical protein